MNPLDPAKPNFSELVTAIRQQLDVSQEDLARQLGVSFATVNRWESGHSKPSRLARAQLIAFCDRMIEHGKLVLQDGQRP
jgi:putative transcriptional regulator